MSYLKKQSAAFYMMIVAAILTLVGVIMYQSASVTVQTVTTLSIVIVALTVVMAVLAGLKKELKVLNLCATVLAGLSALTLILSVNSQLDPLGWWFSGLYSFEQVRGYIIFAALLVVALLLYIIASFIDLRRKAK